jgi:hypothetical protein
MENSTASNPLAKHFRQPSIFLRLPSGGRFYPDGTLELNITGEIPVYPMTVKDELLLKTPDALLNGNSMGEMIRSCCPSIKDPWSIPAIDLDPIFIAVRLASYGQGMDISSNCTHCGTENESTVDLRNLLDSLPSLSNLDNSAKFKDLTFELKPQTFADLNLSSLMQFEQQKLLATVSNSELAPEDKQRMFEESFKKLTDLNIESLVACIRGIRTEDGETVYDQKLIKEFLINTDRQTYDTIHEMVLKFIGVNAVPPVELTCNECAKQYKVNLEFNQSNFFG